MADMDNNFTIQIQELIQGVDGGGYLPTMTLTASYFLLTLLPNSLLGVQIFKIFLGVCLQIPGNSMMSVVHIMQARLTLCQPPPPTLHDNTHDT